jgi:glycosyltransferase involved in cell wall biosynthesis
MTSNNFKPDLDSSTPLVTVIFITYNQSAFLIKAIQSILNQTYKNLEILLCNNGSSDSTKTLLRKYDAENNIRVFNFEENEKYTVRQSFLIDESNGEFICFIAGDDYYLPEYIATSLKVLQNLGDSYGIVHSPNYVERVGSKERYLDLICSKSGVITEDLIKAQITYEYVNCYTPLYRAVLLKEFKPNTSLFFEAESYILRLSMYTQIKYIDKPMYVMLEHDSNMGKNYKQNFSIFLETNLKFIDLNPELRLVVYSTIYQMCIRNAWLSIRLMNDKKWAIECLELSKSYSEFSTVTNRERLIRVLLKTNKFVIFFLNWILNVRYKFFGSRNRDINYTNLNYIELSK